jgi:uracil-DNA glycosylase family 4
VVVGIGSVNAPIYLLLDNPDSESDLVGRPLAGIEGDYLIAILGKAGIASEEVYTTYFTKCRALSAINVAQRLTCADWWELELEKKPKVVVALGAEVGRRLLNMKPSETYGGQMLLRGGRLDAGWYSPYQIFHGGSKLLKQSVAFFKKIKEHLRA